MTTSERKSDFPVKIDLGRKETGVNFAASPMAPESGKKDNPKKYYPTVYIDAIPGLEKLPKEGCMLVHYTRKRLTLEDGADGEEQAGVTLELHRICLDGDAEDEEGPRNLAEAMGNSPEDYNADDDEDGEE